MAPRETVERRDATSRSQEFARGNNLEVPDQNPINPDGALSATNRWSYAPIAATSALSLPGCNRSSVRTLEQRSMP